jgi:predicted MFS family arabinose efflux permease
VTSAPGVLDHRGIGLLGILTICTYGCWYYAFGVLLDPILEDTGWRESTLAASFSAGQIVIGLSSLAGGRLLDRAGHRMVFLLGAVLSLAGLLTASFAQSAAVFFVGATVGLGACGALGFYHVTMPTAVRLNPDGPKAITVLTIWGAFASAIFLPLTAWLVDAIEWRATARVLAGAGASAFAIAAVALPAVPEGDATEATPVRSIVAGLIDRAETRLFTAAMGFGGIAMATMLVYQVPTMTSLGLAAGTASSIAALRGFCQLLGRIPLTPIVTRFGLDRSLVIAFGAVAISGFLLSVSSNVPVGISFAIVAGFGIGAFSPLQGMKTEALFDREDLGATMGLYAAVLLLAGSLGPLAAGLVVEATDDRRWAAGIVVGSALAALLCFAAMLQVGRSHAQNL